MTSPTKPALWPNDTLGRIAEATVPNPAPGTCANDVEALAHALRADLDRRHISIANDRKATRDLCRAAATAYLADTYREQLDTQTRHDISAARASGATWADIASAFAITPRRAMELFNESTIASRQKYEAKRAQARKRKDAAVSPA